jgi:hypothetical protein
MVRIYAPSVSAGVIKDNVRRQLADESGIDQAMSVILVPTIARLSVYGSVAGLLRNVPAILPTIIFGSYRNEVLKPLKHL